MSCASLPRNSCASTGLRPTSTSGGCLKASEVVGVCLHGLEDGFLIFAVPFGDYIEATGGIRAMVSS